MKRLLLPVLVATSLLPAQRLLSEPDGRIVQLFDLRKVRAAPQPADSATDAKTLAEMLAPFVQPPLGTGDALQALGEHFLVLLGSEEQIASIDRVFQTAAARRGDVVNVEVRFVKVDAASFERVAAPHLSPAGPKQEHRYQQLLRKADAAPIVAAILEAAGERLDAPPVDVRPLQRASVAFKKQIAYVKDFTVTAKDGAFIADPLLDVVWDGNETIVSAMFLADGTIGLCCDVSFQEVLQPMPHFKTTLRGTTVPVEIQLPEVTIMRLRQTSIVGDGDVVVLAAKRADGQFLVALVTTSARKG